MTNDMKEVFLLSSTEFSILLAGKGVKSIYTLSKKERQIALEEISLAMCHLYQNNLIDGIDEKFVIKESLDILIEGIKNAKKILLMQQGGKEQYSICCYITEDMITAIQISRQDEDVIKLFAMKRQELFELADDLLEKQVEYISVLDEEDIYRDLIASKRAIEMKEINRFRNIAFLLEEIDYETGFVSSRTAKRQLPQQQVIESYKKGNIETVLYTKENVIEQIKEILEGLHK